MSATETTATAEKFQMNQSLLRSNDLHGVLQVFGNLAAYLGLIVVASLASSIWLMVVVFVAIGIASHRLFFPLHDCLHNTLFRTRSVNTFFGRILVSLLGTTYGPFRDLHLAHHRDFATAEDPGAVDYRVRFATRREFVAFLLAPLVGATFLSRLQRYVQTLLWPASETTAVRASIPRPRRTAGRGADLVALVLVQTGLLLVLNHGLQPEHLWRYPVFAVLPIVTVFLFLNRLRMFLEHASTDYTKTDYLAGTGQPITRTIYATWVERLLLCGGNFNYHHEHHLYPVVPGCNLPLLHGEIKSSIDPIEVRQTYLETLVEIWKHLAPPTRVQTDSP